MISRNLEFTACIFGTPKGGHATENVFTNLITTCSKHFVNDNRIVCLINLRKKIGGSGGCYGNGSHLVFSSNLSANISH